MTKKIEDFGEKINGAKKELWGTRGLSPLDIVEMSDREVGAYVNKKYAWPLSKNHYKELVDNGTDIRVAYFQKVVRDAMPSKPFYASKTAAENYTQLMADVRSKTEGVKEVSNIFDVKTFLVEKGYIVHSWGYSYRSTEKLLGVKLTSKMINVPYKLSVLERDIKKTFFLMSDREKSLAPYKFTLYDGGNMIVEEDSSKPDSYHFNLRTVNGFSNYYHREDSSYEFFVSLSNKWIALAANKVWAWGDTKEECEENLLKIIEENSKKLSEGKARRKAFKYAEIDKNQVQNELGQTLGRNAMDSDFLESLKIRGGQFGNWESEADRQLNMNCCFNSFQNIARALGIVNSDISLGEKLGIAFGARGRGKAMAHYEPLENVINLTKLKGAGSLAHEWGHALDCYLNTVYGIGFGGFATGNAQYHAYGGIGNKNRVGNAVHDLMNAIIYEDSSNIIKYYSEFYQDAKELDGGYSKDGGYWTSNEELFARAFAAYVHDKMKAMNVKDSYATAHSHGCFEDSQGIKRYIDPQGDERKRINEAFDKLFTTLKDVGLLHQRKVQETFMNASKEAVVPVEKKEEVVDTNKKVKYQQLNLLGMM